jgi:hypothetical protein
MDRLKFENIITFMFIHRRPIYRRKIIFSQFFRVHEYIFSKAGLLLKYLCPRLGYLVDIRYQKDNSLRAKVY